MPYRTYPLHPLLKPHTISWQAALVTGLLAMIAGIAIAALSFVVFIPGLS